ncbi:MAG: hypothetical protein EBU66_20315 [Bacteroidetes bacterium]|nr:hypothetical protein [Bacteroidota bacterium]
MSTASGSKLYENTEPETKPTNVSDEELQDFKNKVNEWVKIDEQIRKLQIAIKERRVHKRVLGTQIQEFMTKNGYDNLNTHQGIIKSNIKEVQIPVRMPEVKLKLATICEEKAEFKDVFDKIFNSDRQVVTKSTLRRIVPKVNALSI